jgi:hypothetical protein
MTEDIKFALWFWSPMKSEIYGHYTLEDLYMQNVPKELFWTPEARLDNKVKITFLQYTGFKDAEGEEIYDGYIIRIKYDDTPSRFGQVFFCKGRGKWMLRIENEEESLSAHVGGNSWIVPPCLHTGSYIDKVIKDD